MTKSKFLFKEPKGSKTKYYEKCGQWTYKQVMVSGNIRYVSFPTSKAYEAAIESILKKGIKLY